MKVLIVANYNTGRFSPFVMEQMEALRNEGVEIEIYALVGRGVAGYLSNVRCIRQKIREYRPDLIHAHYGLSGLCANLQRRIPVITTYHGSDIHSGGWILKLSQIAMKLSAFNIFVSREMLELSGYKKTNACIQSCGINFKIIQETPKDTAREMLGLDRERKIGLFSGAFNNKVKNYPLAKAAAEKLKDVHLIELNGFTREEVNLLMNACDFILVTSFRESGPLVIKEAMACGTPVVSVDVGDVKEVIGDVEGCYIAERNPIDIAKKIKKALAFKGKTNGRQRIIDLGLSNDLVSKKLITIYHNVLEMNDVK